MANSGPAPVKYSFVANSDLSAKQFSFVKVTASNTVDICSAATDIPIGILQNKPTASQSAEVLIVGISKVLASATLSAGALIGTDSTGKAAAYVAGTDTTKYAVGVVLDASNGASSLATATIDCAAPGRAA